MSHICHLPISHVIITRVFFTVFFVVRSTLDHWTDRQFDTKPSVPLTLLVFERLMTVTFIFEVTNRDLHSHSHYCSYCSTRTGVLTSTDLCMLKRTTHHSVLRDDMRPCAT
jgi:hypothetical protein